MTMKSRYFALAGIGLGATLLSGCLSDLFSSSDSSAPAMPPAVRSITRMADAAMLETYLKAGIRARTLSYGQVTDLPVMGDGGGTLGSDNAASNGSTGEAASPTASGTNLQEQGVDEADRMKSDGEWLYVLTSPTSYCCFGGGGGVAVMADASTPASGDTPPELRILQVGTNPPQATETARLPLDTGVGGEGLYLYAADGGANQDRLLVVGDTRLVATDWYSPWSWQNGGVDLTEVEVTDRAAPAVRTHVHIDGHMVASRRVGDTLYVVSRFTPVLDGYETYPSDAAAESRNEQLLDAATLSELLPQWRVNGVSQGDLFAAEDCYLLPVSEDDFSADLVTVSAIDLRNLSAAPRSGCLLGPSEAVYASTEALYLATTQYHYTNVDAATTDMAYPLEMSVDVHKFALSATGPELRGSATVAGHLGWHQDKKSFRLGEYDGVLRMVTTVTNAAGEDEGRLTTLAEDNGALVELGHLPNDQRPAPLGNPGEQIYAVRFVGQRGFVVTFRTTDPLYVLDLSNPADPFIAGELHMPGYSDYLHPVSETRLLGIGKDAVPVDGDGDGRGAWYQGVKVALFDITDPAAPTEIDNVVIGQRGSEAGALYDHHALAWLPADAASGRPARLALPVDMHDTAGAYTLAGDPTSWYERTHVGLYMFDIEGAAITPRDVLAVETGASANWWDSDVGSDRALLVNDDVHYLHGDSVWSATWGDAASASAAQ